MCVCARACVWVHVYVCARVDTSVCLCSWMRGAHVRIDKIRVHVFEIARIIEVCTHLKSPWLSTLLLILFLLPASVVQACLLGFASSAAAHAFFLHSSQAARALVSRPACLVLGLA